jgi:hypothetical protein
MTCGLQMRRICTADDGRLTAAVGGLRGLRGRGFIRELEAHTPPWPPAGLEESVAQHARHGFVMACHSRQRG